MESRLAIRSPSKFMMVAFNYFQFNYFYTNLFCNVYGNRKYEINLQTYSSYMTDGEFINYVYKPFIRLSSFNSLNTIFNKNESSCFLFFVGVLLVDNLATVSKKKIRATL